MGLHGQSIFGQRRTTGMPWVKYPECGRRHYLRDYNYEIQWRKDPRCDSCKCKSIDLSKLLRDLE